MPTRETSCCFTGHRPTKLPWRFDEEDSRCLALKARLDDMVVTAYESGLRHFICGMAMGCDMYFAEAVLALREQYDDVTLEAAVPCKGQADGWGSELRRRYECLLERCDMETLVQEAYSAGCMQRRDRYMVDRSALLIAVYDGLPGGTRYTVQYAAGQGVPVLRLFPEIET